MEELTQEQRDEAMVQAAYQKLIDTYMASPHRKKVDLISKAFNFAKQAHKGVRRLSGEPYIMHPLAVAQIACGEIGLGSTSICSALLHDVVEDTEYTVDDLANIFGLKIAQIVDGLTKISGGIFGDKASAQAESFKKLLLTMSDDIRVILIKISDRLHNMRTLGSQPAHKQYKIAGETLYIYAPLAHRLGLNLIKEELEDLSFRYEHPEQHAIISQQIEEVRPQLKAAFTNFIEPISAKLDKLGFHYEIRERIKRPYSIWMKMQNKHVAFDEVYDLLAARIVFDPIDPENEIGECWQIYGACTSIYDEHPDRTRNWLKRTKANGYQALHTTLMSRINENEGRWIEVQIRSRRMDEIAERGFAAHWKYKEGEKDSNASETELDKWLSTIKEILDDPQPSAMDFLDTIKLNLYASEILVVTPKGEFKTMPAGCTALDFAFSIHTFVGTHCMGAKVNHELVPISHELKSGDQVEILTSAQTRVESSWLQFATTAKAKNKIEAILRRQRREQQRKGEEMVNEWFESHELQPTSIFLDRLCLLHSQPTREDLFAEVGAGIVTLTEANVEEVQHDIKEASKGKSKGWKRFIPFVKSTPTETETVTADTAVPMPNINKKKPVILNESNMSQFIFCPTCHPIPGDDILGYLDDQNRVIIHKRQCSIADRLKSSQGNHLIAAQWDMHKLMTFAATIHIEGIDRVGILRGLTDVLNNDFNVNVRRLTIDTKDGIFTGDIVVSVHDAEDLSNIIRNLRNINGMEEVTRVS
ncbi:MAG: bifunctional (p)ppGpp synthetase/guanosine-3',5'-bis(diphosphate) 3'-pyrophosphohydrolase [Bacteroidaceae bacterium]|nr:bifunctional (p)ppGpp synthetase/guanosine-3',5'-bis(diphosphate) 3'-pyrophosphohydrolase [Bacteroidaceae bacterium]